MRGSAISLRSPRLLSRPRSLGIDHRQKRRMQQATHQPPMEEQSLHRYLQKRYYPIKIGERLNERYTVIAKLGYGAYSTVWLARDEKIQQYAAMKVCVCDETDGSPVLNEVNMLKRLGTFAEKGEEPGMLFTRLATDIFQMAGPSGHHHCIVMKPQCPSVRTLQQVYPNAMLPQTLVKLLIIQAYCSINWLHATCGVVHGDLSTQNILLEAADDQPFREIEEQEQQNPSVPIVTEREIIYPSRPMSLQVSGVPIVTDFGQMRLADPESNDWGMSDLYRAPEVLLKLPWGAASDVWALGVITLELLEGKNLFDPIDRIHNQYVLPLALAQYIGYLGPPPLEIVKQSPIFLDYFDEEGNWISEPPIPKTSLEEFVTVIPPGEEKDKFLRFIRKILTWDPAARTSSYDAVHDEWITCVS